MNVCAAWQVEYRKYATQCDFSVHGTFVRRIAYACKKSLKVSHQYNFFGLSFIIVCDLQLTWPSVPTKAIVT